MPMAGSLMGGALLQVHVLLHERDHIGPAGQPALGVGLHVPDNAVPADGGPIGRARGRLVDKADDERHGVGFRSRGWVRFRQHGARRLSSRRPALPAGAGATTETLAEAGYSRVTGGLPAGAAPRAPRPARGP